MKAICIEFNKLGHEPFLDFLKAYAIICVLIGHTFPLLNQSGYPFWAGLQVPIFVLIQAFHVLKNKSSKNKQQNTSHKQEMIIPVVDSF